MRQQRYLRSRYHTLVGYTGQLLIVIGGLHLVPLLLIPFFPDEAALAGGFLLAALPLIALGTYLHARFAPSAALSLTLQEGSVIVVGIWVVAILVSTIPFIVSYQMTFVHALFESTSGWTTTGLTVIDVTAAPKLILFFRSFIQLAGGAGIAIIALGAGAGGGALWGLVMAEGRTDQLAPHVRQSAGIVLRIYIGYIIFGVLALRLAGMGWFDATNHAFAALSTGGFSTRVESIGYWDSPAVEAVTCILMLLGAMNFLTAFMLLQRRVRTAARDGELRLGTLLIAVCALLLFVIVTAPLYEPFKAARAAVFEAISALSGTGFTSVPNYFNWSEFGWLILIFLMSVGGSTGSTSGAIKLYRIYILYKAIVWEIRRAFMPRHMVNEPAIWHGDRRALLDDRQVRQVALFFGMYLTIFLIGSGVFAAFGYPLKESMFEFASTLGNVGLTGGITSPNLPDSLLLIQSFGMLLGRLEIFALIIGTVKFVSDARTILFSREEREAASA
ncbi:MAG: TrkH family potassium uptake protein [Candidatus Flexifilum sp.]|jgi:trk system potassium uptake protein TrkH